LSLPSLHQLGETPREDQTEALFSILGEIDTLQKQEHQKEIERIKEKKPSDYPKTVYVYSDEEIPEGYVKVEPDMNSVFMLRKYSRRVFRNTKKRLFVIPVVITIMGTEYTRYTSYTPIPEAGEAIIPITRKS